MKRNIIVSAVNLTEGGGLTILKQCLSSLSNDKNIQAKYHIIAIVHKKDIFKYNNIEYLEYPKAKVSWLARIYCEYWKFRKISLIYSPILWFSLHDITPNVKADIRAVYCHNPTPFYKLGINDLRFNYKIVLFALFYKYLYRINIYSNTYIVLQQQWLKDAFNSLYHIPKEKIITAIPDRLKREYGKLDKITDDLPIFFFPTVSRQFKNIETLCEAASILHKKHSQKFQVVITINGSEDSYARWLVQKYQCIKEISFVGRLTYEEVCDYYETASCLVFPSRLETWGLPISEFSVYEKPMIIADLPYAHETAAGAKFVSFFDPLDAKELSDRMNEVLSKNLLSFKKCPELEYSKPCVKSWQELFEKLLKNE